MGHSSVGQAVFHFTGHNGEAPVTVTAEGQTPCLLGPTPQCLPDCMLLGDVFACVVPSLQKCAGTPIMQNLESLVT